jgi:hypothetical protein
VGGGGGAAAAASGGGGGSGGAAAASPVAMPIDEYTTPPGRPRGPLLLSPTSTFRKKTRRLELAAARQAAWRARWASPSRQPKRKRADDAEDDVSPSPKRPSSAEARRSFNKSPAGRAARLTTTLDGGGGSPERRQQKKQKKQPLTGEAAARRQRRRTAEFLAKLDAAGDGVTDAVKEKGLLKYLKKPWVQAAMGPMFVSAAAAADNGAIVATLKKFFEQSSGKTETQRAARTAVTAVLGASHASVGKVNELTGAPVNALRAAKRRRAALYEFSDLDYDSLLTVKRKLRADRIRPSMVDYVEDFMKTDELSTTSPIKSEVNAKTMEARKYANLCTFESHELFIKAVEAVEPERRKRLGAVVPKITAFRKILKNISWLRSAKAAVQRQICACPYHTGMFQYWKAWNKVICDEITGCLCADINLDCPARAAAESLGHLVASTQCPLQAVEGGEVPLCGKLACAEGRCASCGIEKMLPLCPTAEGPSGHASWKKWGKVDRPYIKRAGSREVVALVAASGTPAELGVEMRTRLVHMKRHHWTTENARRVRAAYFADPGEVWPGPSTICTHPTQP